MFCFHLPSPFLLFNFPFLDRSLSVTLCCPSQCDDNNVLVVDDADTALAVVVVAVVVAAAASVLVLDNVYECLMFLVEKQREIYQ